MWASQVSSHGAWCHRRNKWMPRGQEQVWLCRCTVSDSLPRAAVEMSCLWTPLPERQCSTSRVGSRPMPSPWSGEDSQAALHRGAQD